MPILANFPLKNQLADTNEVNRLFDCVPACIAACLQWVTGKPFDGGDIKDAVYGKNYTGGTAASAYVIYCHDHGVKLYALDGQPAQLVQDIRSHLANKIPLIGTEPDPYANPSLGWSHVVAFNGYDEPAGTLTALDPFGGHEVTLSDAEWEKRLTFNQVWAFQLEEQDVTIDIHTPIIAAHFEQLSATAWQVRGKTDAAGKPIVLHGGMLSWYCTNGYKPYCGYSCAGLPMSNEIPIEQIDPPRFVHLAGKGIIVVFFERGNYAYDIHNTFGAPEGSGNVYPLKLYASDSPGLDPRLWESNLAHLLPAAK